MLTSRLTKLEREMSPKSPVRAIIHLTAPGRFCEGWLVASDGDRLVNGMCGTVADPEACASTEQTFATKEQALNAIEQATRPDRPLIIIFDEQSQKCL